MTLTEYEKYVQSKINTPVECSMLGLAGEVGELLDKIKKIRYHGHKVNADTWEELTREAGDIQFYLSDIVTRFIGTNLHTVMLFNKDKLDKRYKDKFTSAESIERRDTK
jgi:NTP pyrophosphatase (non-canonical NTP hydrolase)